MDTRIQGAIFDMDGVISDTQSLHARIESDLLRRYGIIMSPEEIIRRFAGTADKEMFPAIFTEAGKRAPDVDAIVAQKYSLMMAPDVAVPEIPGTKAFIASLQRLGIPLAVASASSMEFIRFVVEKLELISSFKALVSSDEVNRYRAAVVSRNRRWRERYDCCGKGGYEEHCIVDASRSGRLSYKCQFYCPRPSRCSVIDFLMLSVHTCQETAFGKAGVNSCFSLVQYS